MSDFYSERRVKRTRRPHQCRECMTEVAVGSPAIVSTGRYDGFFTYHSHVECSEAGRVHAEGSGLWGEDYMFLVDLLDYTEALSWLMERHPVAFERLRLSGRGPFRHWTPPPTYVPPKLP